MSTHYMSDEQFKLVQQTAAHNLAAWKASGVVKTLKWYTAQDTDVCAACQARSGAVVNTSAKPCHHSPLASQPAVAATSGRATC
jgi:hypothetical protein